jgi:FAD/FMN-containing dehydrogenase
MRQVVQGILAVSIAVAAFVTTSCKGAGQSPLASFTRPTAVDPNAVGRISIAGNVIFNGIGQTSQFAATATFNNGSFKDVTADGQWQSSDTQVATVSATGEARIVGLVCASFRSNTRSRSPRST